MTDPTSPYPPTIPNHDDLAPVGSWTVHRAPGNAYDPATQSGHRPIPRDQRPVTPSVPPGLPQPPPAGLTPPQAVAMPMVVPLLPQPIDAAARARAARRSRSAEAALVVAAFVATAGVAFAVGRWSVDDSAISARSPAGLQLPAGVQLPAGLQLPDGAQSSAGLQAAAAASQAPVEPAAPAVDQGLSATGVLPAPGDRPVTDGAITVVDDASTAAGEGAALGRPAFEPPAVNGDGDAAAGRPALGDRQGPTGAMAGFGPAGLQGTVSSVEDGALTIESQDGSLVMVTTDTSTTYVRETTADAAEVTVGDLVRVQTPFGGFRGQGDTGGDAPQVAEQVTLLPDPAG